MDRVEIARAALAPGEELLRFAEFELRPGTGELFRAGAAVSIQPQPLKVLAHLARRPGVLVTREELHRLLWGTNALVDADQGLNFCMAQLRAALEDQPRAPRFVETLPRRGYRFRHPVEVGPAALAPAAVPGPAGPPAPAPGAPGRFPSASWRWAAAALVAAGLGLALAAQQRQVRTTRAEAAAREALEEARAIDLGGGREALKRRLALLERATLLGPGLAAPQAALAEVYLQSAGGDLWGKEAMEKARGHARRALELDPGSASAEVTLGLVTLQLDWAWEEAGRHLERARALDPASPAALTASAVYLSSRGHPEAAVALLEARAPGSAPDEVEAELPWHLYLARRYELAESRLEALVAQHPEDPWPRLQRVYCLALLGREAEALEAAKAFLRATGAPASRLAKVSSLPAREGLVEFFRGRAERQAEQARAGLAIDPAEIAGLFELGGRREEALAWLERGAEERSRWLLPLALADPRFDGLREEPRFRALRARLASP